MLKKLLIRNYILIDELDIQFNEGLTIITGETGAGKSVLLGALGLILGQRADAGALLDKKKKCIIEGVFAIENYSLQKFFKEHELDYESETGLRREITVDGKSRAFINDTPVNLSVLRELADTLVDIHSQHETLTIANSRFQLSVVDAFAGHEKKLVSFKNLFNDHTKLSATLDELKAREQRSKSDLDYYQFQFNELEEARLKTGEQEELETELHALTHSEEIKQQLSNAFAALAGDEENIISHLASVQASLQSIAKYDARYAELAERIKSAAVEIKDIGAEAEQMERQVRFDPSRADEVNERLNTIFKLEQKHHLKTVDELITLKNELEEKLNGIGSLEEEILKMQKEKDAMFQSMIKSAKEISAARKKTFNEIEKSVKWLTTELVMPNAVLKVQHEMVSDEMINSNGLDRITFLFSANKGGEFKELGKVASGGELSRLMLVIKSLLAGLAALPTIIFDEIDTGISGEVASSVGNIMQKIAHKHQVIAITHLPQIAGKGNSHFLVYKTDTKSATHTGIRMLNPDERVNEIARMLSGQKLTEAAIEHAKDLLSI